LHGKFFRGSNELSWASDSRDEAFVMALTYQIHSERSLVVVTRSDRVGAEAWEAFLTALLGDPAYAKGFAILEDRRGLRELPTRVEVERASSWLQQHGAELGATRGAIVVSESSPAAFGMARVREALTSAGPVEVRAFTDYEAALAWTEEVRGAA
jgi:hypothetical protein